MGDESGPTSAAGSAAESTGTPTFFINGKRHDGPFDYEGLVLAIEEAMDGPRNAISA
jgi:protein-disulfide isomerase